MKLKKHSKEKNVAIALARS